MKIELSHDTNTLPIPHIDQYWGAWAIHEDHFRGTLGAIARMDLAAHVALGQPLNKTDSGFSIITSKQGNIAEINLRGTMTKFGSSLSDEGSTLRVRREIRAASRDEDISAILLNIESPGGTVAGTKELSDEVANAQLFKPVTAFIEDIGASAAYAVASQAGQIFANEPAMVGSIGTFLVVADFSRMAANEGIEVHVIKAGEFKGAGTPGTEITTAQIAEWQRLVNQSNELFLSSVARGRKFSIAQVRQLADGRVHIAADALSLGLIDGVRSKDEVIAAMTFAKPTKPKQGKKTMSQESDIKETIAEPIKAKAATIAELEQALPGADAAFVLNQVKASATLQQAQAAWIAEQSERLTATSKELEETKAKQAAKPPQYGGDALGDQKTGAIVASDPAMEWRQKIDDARKQGMTPERAVRYVNRNNPGLREAYVASVNTG